VCIRSILKLSCLACVLSVGVPHFDSDILTHSASISGMYAVYGPSWNISHYLSLSPSLSALVVVTHYPSLSLSLSPFQLEMFSHLSSRIPNRANASRIIQLSASNYVTNRRTCTAVSTAARHFAAVSASVRGGSTSASVHIPISVSSSKREIPSIIAASAISSSFSHQSNNNLRWILLLGSSLLVGGLVFAEVNGENTLCESAAATAIISPTTSSSSVDPIFSPPPPQYDAWNENWDNLADVPLSIDSSGRPISVTRHLIFIRHGQYVLPTKETENEDPVLTQLGHAQAKLTGERLKSLGYDISVIHVSSMARAQQTANDIATSFPGVPIRTSPLLSEGVPCAHTPLHPTWRPDIESLRDDPPRIQNGFNQLVQRWRDYQGIQVRNKSEWDAVRVARMKQDPNSVEIENIELLKERTGREKNEREEQQQQLQLRSTSAGTIDVVSVASGNAGAISSKPPLSIDRYELVVCHGNVIRYSLLRALQLPVQGWLRLAIYNTGISHLIIRSNGHVALQSLGDTGHLPKDMITYS
jgi:broad specificity phosphatase PhoE